jgi:ribosomal protein S27AE
MDTSELHTDGNGVAGLLQQVFAGEITTARRLCDGCGEDHAIGEHLAYSGAGAVLRCPNCGALAATVVALPGEYVLGMHGAWRLAAPS